MLVYKASDIIKRAHQIADLENSSFISYNEQLALLNEAYVMLYQKAVNADTRSYVKEFSTTNKIIPLPEDFYQLKSVFLNTNGYLTPILRRPPDQNLHELSYELSGNTLKIYGVLWGSVQVEYIPMPVTITFPSQTPEPGYIGDDGEEIDTTQLPDTVLSFPNSTYFPYLAYMLAVQFMVKQGKDISMVMSLASAAEDTFYSSMQPDNFSPVRIMNCYSV